MSSETSDMQPLPKKRLPPHFAQSMSIEENTIQQVLVRAQSVSLRSDNGSYSVLLDTGEVVGLIPNLQERTSAGRDLILSQEILEALDTLDDLAEGRWVGASALSSAEEVRNSLIDSFRFIREDRSIPRDGLRPPQAGAVHAVLGYWTTNRFDPATVVMPTGTGKTETMLALFCAGHIERLLIIVPSDALRTQISDKFLSLGWLQEFGVVDCTSLRPVVGQVKHGFSDASTATDFAKRSNVIISTPDALNASPSDARSAIIEACSHLFIDEAHHVAAVTWNAIRREFLGKPVVQFTATPFREDDRRLGGKMLYTFPLREAQRLGYFAKINYIAVSDFYDTDRAIAEQAVAQLKVDLAAGFDHLIMARVKNIRRADTILPLYREFGAEFQPRLLNSKLPPEDQRLALDALRQRSSRIIVCVDMLGEGFDLPSLKIAAVHDAHKSLGVTLQFVGRFSRTASGLGDATVVVARPEGKFDEMLRKLYSEDADWDLIIRDLSEAAIANEEEISEFEEAFNALPEGVSIRSLLPKMSTVVYRDRGEDDWDPQGIYNIYTPEDLLTDPIPVNLRDGVAWFVVEHRTAVEWGEANAVEDSVYDLFVLYWDHDRKLLYINSTHDSFHEDIAKAVCGDEVVRITGENIYRIFDGIDRLVPTNLGVLDARNRNRRFSMYVGTSVEEGLPLADTQTKTKTNLFAWGYERGNRVSIGGSLKGRVWSYMVAKSLKYWVEWCDGVGTKLIDESIDVANIMGNFIRPVELKERPKLVPLALEWPWDILANMRERLLVVRGDDEWPLIDADLEVLSFKDNGPIEIRISTPEWHLDYNLVIADGKMAFTPVGEDAGIKGMRAAVSLREYLNKHGLQIYFERDAVVTPEAVLLHPPRKLPGYDKNLLRDLDWTGINLAVESQGVERRPDCIQAYAIEHIKTLADWDVVLDDDLSYEIADVVALRVEGRSLHIQLTHCKYIDDWVEADRAKPRAVIDDLYVVCGQAMKSARWRRDITALLQNLVRRQKNYFKRTKVGGFMVGTERRLLDILDQSRMLQPEFTIAIAQPGLQKAKPSDAQLELLAATEIYVREVASGQFVAYCSH